MGIKQFWVASQKRSQNHKSSNPQCLVWHRKKESFIWAYCSIEKEVCLHFVKVGRKTIRCDHSPRSDSTFLWNAQTLLVGSKKLLDIHFCDWAWRIREHNSDQNIAYLSGDHQGQEPPSQNSDRLLPDWKQNRGCKFRSSYRSDIESQKAITIV